MERLIGNIGVFSVTFVYVGTIQNEGGGIFRLKTRERHYSNRKINSAISNFPPEISGTQNRCHRKTPKYDLLRVFIPLGVASFAQRILPKWEVPEVPSERSLEVPGDLRDLSPNSHENLLRALSFKYWIPTYKINSTHSHKNLAMRGPWGPQRALARDLSWRYALNRTDTPSTSEFPEEIILRCLPGDF